ncbi:hypothetical protein BU17DRAFT_88808 [Hysterangium stoloniferum]|nr:hypothetical protein BU17DRAFT_88808 [Hysterangium stoloniferum]
MAPLAENFGSLAKDPTVYETTNGPNEFRVIATWKTRSVIGQLHNITASTLGLNGCYDEAQDKTGQPFLKDFPKCKRVQFANSRQTPQGEETTRYLDIVGSVLA